LPTAWGGSTVTGRPAGSFASMAFTLPSLMVVSVATGRCGPCCSMAQTGSTAIQPDVSLLTKSTVVMSFQ